MWRLLIGGIVIGVSATSARGNEADDECREAARRAAAATSTIIARPVAIVDAGVQCPPSASKPGPGCVVGVIRHGATCMPAPGIEVFADAVTTVSDGTGAYRACSLPAGKLVLQAPMAGVTREVRVGDVADLDSTFVGDFGIPLAQTSIVTLAVDRVVDGPLLGTRIDVFVQHSPPAVPARIAIVPVRPSYELGRPLEVRVARDTVTQVLVAETCWIRPAVPAPSPSPSPAPVRAPRSSCGHCGSLDPSVFAMLALLGLRRRRRQGTSEGAHRGGY